MDEQYDGLLDTDPTLEGIEQETELADAATGNDFSLTTSEKARLSIRLASEQDSGRAMAALNHAEKTGKPAQLYLDTNNQEWDTSDLVREVLSADVERLFAESPIYAAAERGNEKNLSNLNNAILASKKPVGERAADYRLGLPKSKTTYTNEQLNELKVYAGLVPVDPNDHTKGFRRDVTVQAPSEVAYFESEADVPFFDTAAGEGYLRDVSANLAIPYSGAPAYYGGFNAAWAAANFHDKNRNSLLGNKVYYGPVLHRWVAGKGENEAADKLAEANAAIRNEIAKGAEKGESRYLVDPKVFAQLDTAQQQQVVTNFLRDIWTMRVLQGRYGSAWHDMTDEEIKVLMNGMFKQYNIKAFPIEPDRLREVSTGLETQWWRALDIVGGISFFKNLDKMGFTNADAVRTMQNWVNASPDDRAKTYERLYEATRQLRGSTGWNTIWEVTAQMIPFALEFVAMDALLPGANAGLAVAERAMRRGFLKGAFAKAAQWAFLRAPANAAVQNAVFGGDVKAVMSALAEGNEYITPELTQDGTVLPGLTADETSTVLSRVTNNLIDAQIETWSEYMGGAVDLIPVGKGLAKVFSRLPYSAKVPIALRALSHAGAAFFSPKAQAAMKMFRRSTKINGLLGEYTEEKIGDLARTIITSVAEMLGTQVGNLGQHGIFGSWEEEGQLLASLAVGVGVMQLPASVIVTAGSWKDTMRGIDIHTTVQEKMAAANKKGGDPNSSAVNERILNEMGLQGDTAAMSPDTARLLFQERPEEAKEIGITDAAMIDRAEKNGQMLVISTAEMHARLSSETVKQLLPNLYFGESKISLADAQALDLTEEGIAAVRERKARIDSFRVAHDNLVLQLRNAGVDAETSRFVVRLLSAASPWMAARSKGNMSDLDVMSRISYILSNDPKSFERAYAAGAYGDPLLPTAFLMRKYLENYSTPPENVGVSDEEIQAVEREAAVQIGALAEAVTNADDPSVKEAQAEAETAIDDSIRALDKGLDKAPSEPTESTEDTAAAEEAAAEERQKPAKYDNSTSAIARLRNQGELPENDRECTTKQLAAKYYYLAERYWSEIEEPYKSKEASRKAQRFCHLRLFRAAQTWNPERLSFEDYYSYYMMKYGKPYILREFCKRELSLNQRVGKNADTELGDVLTPVEVELPAEDAAPEDPWAEVEMQARDRALMLLQQRFAKIQEETGLPYFDIYLWKTNGYVWHKGQADEVKIPEGQAKAIYENLAYPLKNGKLRPYGRDSFRELVARIDALASSTIRNYIAGVRGSVSLAAKASSFQEKMSQFKALQKGVRAQVAGKLDNTIENLRKNGLLYQSGGNVTKGVTTPLNQQHEATIALFANAADASTAIHETAHYLYSVMEAMVYTDIADDQLKEDFDKLTTWAAQGGASYTEAMEKIATALEAWVMEGKAPNESLKTAFNSMAKMMVQIYKSMRLLLHYADDQKVNDEVRDVFNRMFAAENIFTNNSVVSMTVDEVMKALEGLPQVTKDAMSNIAGRAVKEGEAKVYADYAHEIAANRPKWRAEAEAALDADPIYTLVKNVGTKFNKLDYNAVAAMTDVQTADRLYELGLAGKAGELAHPGQLASAAKMDDPIEMIRQLAATMRPAAFIRQQMQMAEDEFRANYVMSAEAQATTMGIQYYEKLAKLLQQKVGNNERLEQLAELRQRVKEDIETGRVPKMQTVGQILDYGKGLQQNAQRLALRIADAYRRGDSAVAFTCVKALRYQLEMLRQVGEIRDNIARTRSTVNAAKHTKKGVAEEEFIVAMKKLATLFGFTSFKVEGAPALPHLPSFAEWNENGGSLEEYAEALAKARSARAQAMVEHTAMRQEQFAKLKGEARAALFAAIQFWNNEFSEEIAEGMLAPLELNNEIYALIERSTPYTRMSVAEFNQVAELFTWLSDNGRAIVTNGKAKFAEKIKNDVATLKQWLTDHGVKMDKVKADGIASTFDKLLLSGTPLRWIVNRMSNGDAKHPMQRIYDEMSIAASRETQLSFPILKKLTEAVNAIDKLLDGVSFLGLPVPAGDILTEGFKWDKQTLLMACLYMGRKESYQRLLQNSGEEETPWTDADLNVIASRMPIAAWQHIQNIWDALDDPALSEAERKAYREYYHGEMPKSEARSFTVSYPDGTAFNARGGYVPISYMLSRDNGRMEEMKKHGVIPPSDRMRQPGCMKDVLSVTPHPLSFKFNSIYAGVLDRAHFAAYASTMKEALSLIHNHDFATTIKQAYGHNVYNAMAKLIENLASPDKEAMGFIDQALKWGRMLFTANALWGKVSPVFMQAQSITNGINLVGADAYFGALRTIVSHPAETHKFITSTSAFMANRFDLKDVDLKKVMNDLTESNYKKLLNKAREVGFAATKLADSWVAAPVWLAEYNKTFNSTGNQELAIAKADEMVAKTQGGSRTIDLTPVQLSSIGRFVTIFYSPNVANHQLMLDSFRQMFRADTPEARRAAASAIFCNFFLPMMVIGPLLRAILASGKKRRDKDNLSPFWAAWLRETLSGPFSGIPLARDVADFGASAVVDAINGRGISTFGRNATAPGAQGIAELFTSTADIARAMEDGDMYKVLYEIADAVTYGSGVPAVRATENMIRLFGGDKPFSKKTKKKEKSYGRSPLF